MTARARVHHAKGRRSARSGTAAGRSPRGPRRDGDGGRDDRSPAGRPAPDRPLTSSLFFRRARRFGDALTDALEADHRSSTLRERGTHSSGPTGSPSRKTRPSRTVAVPAAQTVGPMLAVHAPPLETLTATRRTPR